MKKILWIACLLCLMPFFGYAQFHASLGPQDYEELFGQATVSTELPSHLTLHGIQPKRAGESGVWAHAMYIPPRLYNFGRYYEVASDGTITQKKMYNDWYYSSAEYRYIEGSNYTAYPVWAYANDYTRGFMALDLQDGNFVEGEPIVGGMNTMNDITFDYHGMRMLGVKYGRIYEVTILTNGNLSGQTALLYDYEDHNNLMPIAIAADLNGDIYFVSTTENGQSSKLYKYAADADMEEDEPTLVGDLGWPAKKIQTMSFDHNTGNLYWWACLEVMENSVSTSRSQLFEVDKEDASKTAITDTLTTEIGGLFFEFDYSPHWVHLIQGTGGDLFIDTRSNGPDATFLPGQDVTITSAANACQHITGMTVYKSGDHTTVIASTFNATTGTATFVMPAFDVDVEATWAGNVHTITYTATPNNSWVSGNPTATCGSDVVINYTNYGGYILTDLTAAENRANLTVTVTNGATVAPATGVTYPGKAKFTITDYNVTVNGVYKAINLGQIPALCQFQAPATVPSVSVPGYAATNYGNPVYKVKKPGETTWTVFTSDDMTNPDKFDKAGSWSYRAELTNTYGTFTSSTNTFQVYAAPREIAIEGLQYNCEGDSMILNVVGTPDNITLNGTFEWYKNHGTTPIATTTVPQYVKYPITKAGDAGTYSVVYTPASGNNPVCEFTSNDLMVNVSTLPNKPIIELVGVENPVCYNTEVQIQWLNGVLDPDQYELRWYGVPSGVTLPDSDDPDFESYLVLIEGATGRILTTPHLTHDTTYVLRINYAGVNALCDRFGEPFTVTVQEEGVIPEIAGSIETCAGFVPDVNPSVPEEYYTNVIWIFGNAQVGFDTLPAANGNELHFENTELNGDLLDVPGLYTVKVQADSLKMDGTTGCTMFGEYEFLVKALPDVYMVNNITSDTVRYSDHMPEVTIPVCHGELVILAGRGADHYSWGWNGGHATGDTLRFQATETMDYELTGHCDTTDCEQSVKVRVQVNPRPVITWIHPSQDTTFSMITEEFQLVATPANGTDNGRGIFTYIIPSDPNHQSHPIENGLFKPAELGIGQYWLIYSFQDSVGCRNEARLNIEVVKPYWTDIDIRDTTWFANCQAAGRWEISNPYELGAFGAYLNYDILDPEDQEGIYFYDFTGDTIYITNNIDLQEKPYFYRPINDFQGVLDGTGKVISNAVLMEDGLTVTFNGFIRNMGFKDPKLTNTGTTKTNITCVQGASFHNSYGTMPLLTNMTIPPHTVGSVRNVYYYGPDFRDGHEGEFLKIYIESEQSSQWYQVPGPDTLCHIMGGKDLTVEYEGILQDWVWLQNDFSYYDWMTDDGGENYGYPVMRTSFIHHHYVDVITDDYDGEYSFNEAVMTRTINGVDYTYAYHNTDVIVTLNVDQYTTIDTVEVDIHNYMYAGNDIQLPVAEPYARPLVINIAMPLDSVYMEAYNVTIRPVTHRDYWTDYGNFNETWYQDCEAAGRWEIVSNEDLAALARVVNYGYEHTYNTNNGDSTVVIPQYTFADDTIWIVGSETTNSEFLNMAAHLWDPMVGFAGVLNGTHFIIDSIYVRGGKEDPYKDVNAMFVDMSGIVYNLGVQDINLPQPESKELCSVFALTENFPDTLVPGQVINSFFTTNPELHQQYNIADPDMTVTNSYILNSNNMQVDGAGEGIDIDDLHAWVVAQVQADDNMRYILWDWVEDEDLINYGYCIHAPNHYTPGYAITYIPDINHPNNGYVSGPADAQEGTSVCGIELFPAEGYNCTQLIVYLQEGGQLIPYDTILATGQYAECFRMPNGPVTVEGTMTPIDWNFTLYFMEEGTNEIVATTYTSVQHYQDVINVNAPEVAGMTPEVAVYENVMPNNHFVDTLFYTGDTLNVFFCEDMLYDVHFDTAYTDHENNQVRYRDNVTVTIVPAPGLSIGLVTITYTDTENNDQVVTIYEGRDSEITFTMPRFDVMVCATWDEEYWDDYGIADISWFFDNEDDDVFFLTTDSMLGGLAALVSSRQWLVDEGYYEQAELANFDFAGKLIIVQSEQEENMIDLIEHKWRPIGAQISFGKMFQGTFDGNGQKIINMRTADIALLDEPGNGSCQAFFGTIGEDGIVTDLDIEGLAEGRYFTAGIAGVNHGVIMNSRANVMVRSEFEAGGIVGNNYGMILNSYCDSEGIECWSAAPATKDGPTGTNDYYVGGIAAFNEVGGLIQNCHNVAPLIKGNGTNPINYYGELVGYNLGDVEYSYYDGEFDVIGGGDLATTGCAAITATTANAMNAKAAELTTQYGETFFGWTNGENNYPVFDVNRDFMSINSEEIQVNLYPNPTRGDVKISCNNAQIQKVTVFNMFGQMVLDREMNAFETSIYLGNYTTGVYMVRITTANGIVTKNVVVE